MRFPVEKTNRTIKAILAKSVGEFWTRAPKGREVFVEEVDPSWEFETGLQPDEYVYWVGPDGKFGDRVTRVIRKTDTVGVAPNAHFAVLVAEQPKAGRRTVTIYIPQLDQGQLDVARDALLVGDKQLIATALAPFGIYGGVVRAILERQIRSFAKAANPKKSTKQIQREVDDFLRSQGRL